MPDEPSIQEESAAAGLLQVSCAPSRFPTLLLVAAIDELLRAEV